MKSSTYKTKVDRLELLLKQLTVEGKLSSSLQKELDEISDDVQEYEEKHYSFKADTLNEMIELRMYQRKLEQKNA